MPVQLKENKKMKSTPMAGPSADDRGAVAPTGGKPIEGRIGNVLLQGTQPRPRIKIMTSGDVHVGMSGYIRDGVDGVLASFVIDEVNGSVALAFVDIDRSKIQLHALCIINAAPPKVARAPSKPSVIAHSVAGNNIQVTISHGTDRGVFPGMQGELVAPDGKRLTFKVVTATARTSIAYVNNTTLDEVRRHPAVEFATASAAVQRRASGAGRAVDVNATAQAGVAGASSPLPFLDTIQRAFGKHDVSGVRAQIGGPAAAASNALGAHAYATGNTVAFTSAPDLHTAAHEAAHTVQQARGSVGFQGLGAADDEHERHADAVADAVVAGRSAEAMLEVGTGPTTTAVQRKAEAETAERNPFLKPFRPTFDWRKHIRPRAMPESPQALECEFDAEPARAGRHEHSGATKPSPTHTSDDLAWPALRDVSKQAKTTHDNVVAEVSMYKNAHADPTLKAFLYSEPKQPGSLASLTNRQHSPERDGIQVGSFFDEEGQLALEPSTHGAIAREDRPRARTDRAAASTVEKSAALHAAIHALRGAVEGLRAARSDVEDVAHEIAMERASDHAVAVGHEIQQLQDEASDFKAAFDAAFAFLAGMAHIAEGEVGDAIAKIGELAGMLLSRMNDRTIANLEASLAVTKREIKSERVKSLAARLDARKARVRQSTHLMDSARSAIVAATSARSAAYKSLGREAAGELEIPDQEKRKVSAMISALPLIELVASRARSIATTSSLPPYSESADHGLWQAVAAGDTHVASFLRALDEIAGARELYGRVANQWERRLAQVKLLANSVGSHASE